MKRLKKTQYVREGRYVAEVDVEYIEEGSAWTSRLCADDAYKLDDVRDALRRGDLESAEQYGRVYELGLNAR